ncbi:calmodulin-regulated spectrin-associated protein 2-like protein [Leptotrombidium deliense]|uniref:Calmodulin-regulated spectrin-associated protein 2-like protein n=1 Tax=Leptotrombidium deliense TaxID=299467 RepID=A0A443SI37_9ACAR|nr:calmodulin-regulated spectrin-associated protein 2-like protein [Leptotrombidium deliense]
MIINSDLNFSAKLTLDERLKNDSRCKKINYSQAKHKASILWILSKAYNNEIPSSLQDPYYRDNENKERLKPQIVHSLANTEIYCLALSNIYSDPYYSCLSHQDVLQLLTRKGVSIVQPADAALTETVLMQTAPLRMSAHMAIIDAMMALFVKEVLIPEKVVEVVTRFIAVDSHESLPNSAEDAALFWINKSCLKQRMDYALFHSGSDMSVSPPLLILEDLVDLSDGCSLATLLSFYCPEQLNWTDVCFNESMAISDRVYNLQLVQYFCQEKLQHNICFLTLDDFLYIHETIRLNVLAFVADLLYLFEIKPAPCVKRPGTKDELAFSDSEEDVNKGFPDLPSPAEMKRKQLQHSGWDTSGYRNSREETKLNRDLSRSLRRLDEDDAFQHYSIESGIPSDRHPDVIFSKPYDTVSVSNFGKPLTKYKFQVLQRSRSASKSKSPTRSERSERSDSVSDLSSVEKDKQSPTLTTNFLKISSTKQLNGSQNKSEIQTTPAINIAFKPKADRPSHKTCLLNDSTSIKDVLRHYTEETKNKATQDITSNNDVQNLLKDIKSVLEAKQNTNNSEIQNKNINHDWKREVLINQHIQNFEANAGEEKFDVRILKQDLEDLSRRLTEHEKTFQRSESKKSESPIKSNEKSASCNKRQETSDNNLSNNSNSSQVLENISNVVEYSEPQVSHTPKRGTWGQPAVPFANGSEYQWIVAPIPPNIEPPFYPRYPRNPYEMYSMQMYSPQPPQMRNVYDYPSPQAFYRQPVPPQFANHTYPIYAQPNELYRPLDSSNLPPIPSQAHNSNCQRNEENVIQPTVVDHNQISSPQRQMTTIEESASNNGNNVTDELNDILQTPTRNNRRNASERSTRKKSVDSEVSSSDSVHSKNNNSSGENDCYDKKGFFIQLGEEVLKPKPPLRKKPKSLQKRSTAESNKEKGLGFVVGEDTVNSDPFYELEMAKKKEHMIFQSLRLYNVCRLKRDETMRKKEDDKMRRQMILEKFRLKKSHEDPDNNGFSDAISCKDTLILHGASRARPNTSGMKKTQKSYHASTMQLHNCDAFEPKSSRTTDDIDVAYNFRPSMNGLNARSCSRLTSDGDSDSCSMLSEYTGPKLFVKPTQKSNRGLILNALNVVLGGPANADARKRVLQEINSSESKHFIILFRGTGMQFRAIYSYNTDREEVFKLYGTGPKVVNNDMIEKFYKYNSGTKSFNDFQTKNLTVTVDAITIHSNLWAAKRIPSTLDLYRNVSKENPRFGEKRWASAFCLHRR